MLQSSTSLAAIDQQFNNIAMKQDSLEAEHRKTFSELQNARAEMRTLEHRAAALEKRLADVMKQLPALFASTVTTALKKAAK